MLPTLVVSPGVVQPNLAFGRLRNVQLCRKWSYLIPRQRDIDVEGPGYQVLVDEETRTCKISFQLARKWDVESAGYQVLVDEETRTCKVA